MLQSSSFHRSEKSSRKSGHGSSVRPRDVPPKASRRPIKGTAAGADSTAFGQEHFIEQNNKKILASLFDEKSSSKSNNSKVTASFNSRNGSHRISPRSKEKSNSKIPCSRSPRISPLLKKKSCSDTPISKQKPCSRSPQISPRSKKESCSDTPISNRKPCSKSHRVSPRSKKKSNSDTPSSGQKSCSRSPRMPPRLKKKSCSDTPSSEQKPRSNRSDCLDNYDATDSSNPFFETSMKNYDDEIDYLSCDDPTDLVDKTSTWTVATQPLSAASMDLRKNTPYSVVETKRWGILDSKEKDEKKDGRKNRGRRRALRWVNAFTKNPLFVGYMT